MAENKLIDDHSQFLQRCLQTLGIPVNQSQQRQLIDYLVMLKKWNQRYNLTAVHDLRKMIIYHVLDSLAISPHLNGQRILDVGCGAGLPSIPLAICHMDKQFVLIDSNGKKTRFVSAVKIQNNIDNISVHQQRMEKFSDSAGFDVIMCRAVGEIHTIMQATRHLIHQHGLWLFMKGKMPSTELRVIKQLVEVIKLDVPELEADRHLVIVKA